MTLTILGQFAQTLLSSTSLLNFKRRQVSPPGGDIGQGKSVEVWGSSRISLSRKGNKLTFLVFSREVKETKVFPIEMLKSVSSASVISYVC